ncbi:MAG TPA: hypothetical protein VLC47_08460 [Burkholderiales bacterium]|nr:hypothetical protein [Burkholderiales bacterium]
MSIWSISRTAARREAGTIVRSALFAAMAVVFALGTIGAACHGGVAVAATAGDVASALSAAPAVQLPPGEPGCCLELGGASHVPGAPAAVPATPPERPAFAAAIGPDAASPARPTARAAVVLPPGLPALSPASVPIYLRTLRLRV